MPRGQFNVKVNVNVYDETDVPDMRDQITESPRRMALSFTAAALSMTVPPGLRPTQQLPVDFRNRWASESDKDSSPPMFQAKSRFYQPTVLSEDGADVKTVCVATNADTLEKLSAVGVCGPASFDSTDDGMVCVVDPESDAVKWICSAPL